MGDSGTLQDGRYPHSERPPEVRGLACESGPEGCLFHSPHRHQSPAVTEVHAGQGGLPVHIPSLWSILWPPHIHQGYETADDPSQIMGGQVNHSSGRYADSSRDCKASSSALRSPGVAVTGPGIYCQSGEIGFYADQEDRVPGSGNRLELSLLRAKLRQIRGDAEKLLSQTLIPARCLFQFIGKLNAAAQAVIPAPLFYRHLHGSLKNALASGNLGYENTVTLPQEAREELIWWPQYLQDWNGRCLLKCQDQVISCSDASLLGWGVTCNGLRTGGLWSELERSWHINFLEMQAASLVAQSFLRDQTTVSVLLWMDNTTAVAYINNLWGTVSPQLTSLAKSLWLWALQKDIMLTAQHISGVSNLVTDTESRTIRDRSDWKLNPAVFTRINKTFRPLKVDLFASRLTYRLPRFFSWRPDPLAETTDVFQQNWGHLKGFANPPDALWGKF